MKTKTVKLNHRYFLDGSSEEYLIVREDLNSYYIAASYQIEALLLDDSNDLDFQPIFELNKSVGDELAATMIRGFLVKNGCNMEA